jgi:hypothetical protein
MKRIMLFVGLKVLEIFVFIITWTGFCFVGVWMRSYTGLYPMPFFIEGLVPLATIMITIFIALVLKLIILINWEWTGRILKK